MISWRKSRNQPHWVNSKSLDRMLARGYSAVLRPGDPYSRANRPFWLTTYQVQRRAVCESFLWASRQLLANWIAAREWPMPPWLVKSEPDPVLQSPSATHVAEPALIEHEPTPAPPESTPAAKAAHRPRKYDWDSFLREIVRIANKPDGLPETQADLEKQMAAWCLSEWGNEPAESMIRDKVSDIYREKGR